MIDPDDTSKVFAGFPPLPVVALPTAPLDARAFVTQLPMPAALFEGRDHRVTASSPAFRELMGIPDPLGRPLAEVLGDAAPAGLIDMLDRVHRNGESLSGTHELPGPDGPNSHRFANSVFQPVRDSNGETWAIIAQVADATDRVRAEQDREFLAQVSDVLASTIDYEETLTAVTELAVRGIADWCAVDELAPDGRIRRLAVAHPDPEMVKLAHELAERYAPDPNTPHGAGRVIRTGELEFVPEITDNLLVKSARDEEHLRIVRALGLSSFISVPLIARGEVLGALTLVTSGQQRRFDSRDLRLALEVARRAAVAIDNARLYRRSELARARLEEQAAHLESQAEELQATQAELELANDELQDANVELEVKIAEAERALAVAHAASERLRRLQVVSAALNQAATPEQVAEVCVGHGIAALGASAGSLALRTEAGDALRLVSTAGFAAAVVERWREFAIAPGKPLSDAVLQRKTVLVGSRTEWLARYPDVFPDMQEAGTLAYAAVPLMVGAEIVAGLSFCFAEERVFDEADRSFLSTLGQQTAQALERARLFEAEREAREEAEIANRAKTEFLSAMSHELRTPLNAIAGYLDLLELGVRGPLNDAQLADLRRIKHAQNLLLGLINDILSFARIEAGRIAFTVEPIPVRELLLGLDEIVGPQLAAKKLRYRCDLGDVPMYVLADAERFRQILINLLSNAVKFTDVEGHIQVSAWSAEGKVMIRVADTGRGIPEEKLDTIFDPFVQVGRWIGQESQQGVGLGLAISRELARGMGGELTVTSTPGEGSAFTLELPSAQR